jgi:Zn-dependent M28 family amino/carboxypeptidase
VAKLLLADPKPEAGHFFRSDHFPFAKRGVPAISFGSGEHWERRRRAAGKAEEDRYTGNNYHQPSDEWSAEWPFTGMARDLGILYSLGRDLAESKAWPNWAADSPSSAPCVTQARRAAPGKSFCYLLKKQ